MVKDLTNGKPIKLILNFCLPLMLGQVFQQLYNMVDSIIVGRFAGTAELSAVGSTGALSFMVIGFVSGLTAGITIPVSQSFGEGNHSKLRKYYSNGVYLAITFSALLTLITYFLTKPLLRIMNTPDSIMDMAYDYIGIVFLGLTATIFYNFFASVMRALGDSKTPLYLLIFSSVTNIGLDLLFVIVFRMACKGVAIATVIAQALSAVIAYIVIIKKYDILKCSSEEKKLSLHDCGRLLFIGLPMALQFSVTAIGSIILQSAVNILGETVIAAVTIAGKIQLLVILPVETIGITMATFCGQNLGAKRMDRIKTGTISALALSMIYSAAAMVTVFFFARLFGTLFVSSDQVEVLDDVVQFLHTSLCFYPVICFVFVLRNAIQGMGYSIPAMMAGFFELAARSVMGWVVIPRFGYTAVCFAHPSAWFAADLLLVPVFFIVYFKLKKTVIKE